jgi:hypothetical protein
MRDAEAHADTYRFQTVLTEDRTLTLTDLPFQAGDVVEVIIRPRHAPSPEQNRKRYAMQGQPLRYDRPTDPVAEEDWDAVR